MEREMPRIAGLPVHPLVVHVVVVLLPLAAVAAVAVAVVPRVRHRYGLLVGVLNMVAVAAVPAAMVSGNWLYDHRVETLGGHPGDATEATLIEQHKDIANSLWPWAVLLLVGVLLVLALPPLAARVAPVRRWRVPLAVLAAVVTLVGAGFSLELVVRIGEAGAKAAWSTR
jgi:hypothetical protein